VVPFTDDECEALRAAAPDWFAAALTLGLGAGLRLSEATGLTLDRIDEPHDRRAQLPGRRLSALSASAGNPDAGARGRECLRHGPPEAARRPGHGPERRPVTPGQETVASWRDPIPHHWQGGGPT